MKIIKYISLLLFIFLSTGCLLGSAGKGYLQKTCTSSYETDDIKKSEKITITHKDNQVVTIESKYIYEFKGNKHVFKSFKDSNISQINSLEKEKGIKAEVVVDNAEEYTVVYIFDINKVSLKIKELYGFEDEYHIQKRKLEEKGYICK